ncbi:MAG TPA: nucleoside triphosphate pyrophosphohydrolase [Candidatus Cloacimonadota bacterium]|nr:nucleoside triphosphate pyrophosphohydrolase [Candidatus Cloacimonadota bacterium]
MKEFDQLIDIMARLRDPETGCPWDIKQTPMSLRANFIEELYEAVEAIEADDPEALSEELGDLMLHIVFQARMADEQQLFDIRTVLEKINSKLIRRHPHIFSDAQVEDAAGVKQNWELIKKREKKHRKSILDGIPGSMPALIHAWRTQEKAAALGFDWSEILPVIEKIEEELDELKSAIKSQQEDQITMEIGDLLFSVVNLARKLNIDAEAALKASSRKFTERFHFIEEYYETHQKDIKSATLEELDQIWELAKKQ